METLGGDREKNQHHEMRITHPYPFLEVVTPRRETRLRSESMGKFVHSYMQSSLDDDVSLHGDISPRRLLDQQRRMDASHVGAQLMDFRKVETLGEPGTTLRVWGRLREERDTLSTSFVPTLISYSTLWQKQQVKDNKLLTCIFGMGYVKE